MIKLILPFCLFVILGFVAGDDAQSQTIPVYALAEAPTLDGNDDDWRSIPATTVALKPVKADGTLSTASVQVKGGTHGNRVYFLFEWEDRTENNLHKPWVWDEASGKYILGPQREDRLAIQFGMGGKYSTNWLSGEEFTADTWHWKSSRSNPLGLAHDKKLTISRKKLLRASKLRLPDGGHIYISRPSDNGDKLYTTKRYRGYEQPLMPKYILSDSPKGSISDVSARGVWSGNRWRLELSRLLDTGNEDDIIFPQTQGKIVGGIAVFDQSENDDHVISDTLTFAFHYRSWAKVSESRQFQ
ncbi:MAG: hypothetical protein KDI43_06680 [Gammaproteobacteria bacterium]|nr:hypothetical protein [Gammaproteobacteria bacterium]